MGKVYSIVENDTGEICGEIDDKAYNKITKQPTVKQLAVHQKYKERQCEVECFKNTHREDGFIMFIFGEKCEKYDLSDLKPQTATRLIYLATWLNYNDNCLKIGNNAMTREQLQSLMLLEDSTFKRFLKEITEKGYLIKSGSQYCLNEANFKKGEFKADAPLTEKRFVRVSISYVRKLYEQTPQSLHKHLGYVFKMIPYVNIKYNIICHNPLEEDESSIIPMTIGEFCDAIGYDKNQVSRLINIYDNITFEADGQRYVFCGYRWAPKKANMRIYVNPLIFYAGNDFSRVEILKVLFA